MTDFISSDFCDSLKEQTQMLNKLCKQKESSLRKAIAGKLRIMFQGINNVPRFYHITEKYSNGTYLNETRTDVVRKLAQKGYDEKLFAQIKKIHRHMNGLNNNIKDLKLDEIYDKLPQQIKCMVSPFRQTNADFLNQWFNRKYEGKSFSNEDVQIFSTAGIRVRSKSEAFIADALTNLRIPFHYEYPVEVKGMGVVHPDFTCLNKRTRKEFIWEHFGMMSQEKYARKNVEKITLYANNGYFPGDNLIITFETEDKPLSPSTVKKVAAHYLL